jgi:excinuclease ABC subunit C
VPELFSAQPFTGFGPDPLHAWEGGPRLFRIQARRPSGLLSQVRLDCPRRSGVYGMVDERGEVIYVGKARCLRTRLLSYFRPRSRDPKAGAIIRQTRLLAWEVLPTELSALLRELELIRRWQPRFNVQGQPRRARPAWVCVGRRPAPHVFLAYRVPSTAEAAFGPVPGGAVSREAVRRLNDLFGLRDCPSPQTMVFADERELFPLHHSAGCLRLEIGHCLGPCAAACSRDDYHDRVREVHAFLDGEDGSLLARLEEEMTAAAQGMQFERAGVLRDRLAVLGWLRERLDRLKAARRLTLVYPLQGSDARDWWYVLSRGQVRAIFPAPASANEATAVGRRLGEVLSEKRGRTEQAETLLLIESWFRRSPEELARGLSLEEAIRRCAPG